MAILGRLAAGDLTVGEVGLTTDALRLAEAARRYEEENARWIPRTEALEASRGAIAAILAVVGELPGWGREMAEADPRIAQAANVVAQVLEETAGEVRSELDRLAQEIADMKASADDAARPKARSRRK